jgi:hypothetical protein
VVRDHLTGDTEASECFSMTDDQQEQNRARAAHDDEERSPTPTERAAIRENAKRVIRESGIGEMLQALNRNALQGRGWFEEYDSGVLFKWGAGYTRRHIWIDIIGDQLRFRLRPHLVCAAPIPLCDGEYHSFTAAMWRQRGVVLRELHRNYEHPVAETSED